MTILALEAFLHEIKNSSNKTLASGGSKISHEGEPTYYFGKFSPKNYMKLNLCYLSLLTLMSRGVCGDIVHTLIFREMAVAMPRVVSSFLENKMSLSTVY